jgi:diguanylate cyclase (GGDEF)-like protein
MQSSLEDMRSNRRVMAYTAAAMYGAAAVDGLIEGVLPGDPSYSLLPVAVVLVVVVALVVAGPRLPRRALFLLGPLGVALVSYALSTSPGAGDGAVLYALPVLWTTVFFSRRGAIAVVACVGVGQLITLLELPAASSFPGRWVDVMASVCAISVVVLVLERRNELLLTRLRGEARTDLLTGLLNRRGFDERAAIELAHAKREHRSIAVATFDLDRFKHINDEWGHQTGDLVLAWIGALLADQCRDVDVAARFGGEEFVVLLPGIDCAGAAAFTERVRRALSADGTGELPTVRVSAGVHAAVAPADVQVMLQHADTALYEAKHAGRDRTAISRPSDGTPPHSGLSPSLVDIPTEPGSRTHDSLIGEGVARGTSAR